MGYIKASVMIVKDQADLYKNVLDMISTNGKEDEMAFRHFSYNKFFYKKLSLDISHILKFY